MHEIKSGDTICCQWILCLRLMPQSHFSVVTWAIQQVRHVKSGWCFICIKVKYRKVSNKMVNNWSWPPPDRSKNGGTLKWYKQKTGQTEVQVSHTEDKLIQKGFNLKDEAVRASQAGNYYCLKHVSQTYKG